MLPDSVMMSFVVSLLIFWASGAITYTFYRESALMIVMLQLVVMGLLWFSFPFLVGMF